MFSTVLHFLLLSIHDSSHVRSSSSPLAPFFFFFARRAHPHISLPLPVVSLHPLVVFVLGSFLKSRFCPQSDLYYYDPFSLSPSSSCSIVAWVCVCLSPSNLLPCILRLNGKRRYFVTAPQ